MNKRVFTFIIYYLLLIALCSLFPISLVSSSGTQVSLNPSSITLPLSEQPMAVYIELRVENVQGLKRYSFELDYNKTVLEFINSKMDNYFFTTVNGFSGSGFQGSLGKSFSGSAVMFVYAFKILNMGTTNVDIVNASLWTDNGQMISNNVTGCTIIIKSLEEWIDGQYAELKVEWDNYHITHNFTDLQFYNALNETDHWKTEYNSLNATYTQYIETYHYSDDEYNSLLSENQRLMGNLGTSQNLNYVLIMVSVILVATTVYFASRKNKHE